MELPPPPPLLGFISQICIWICIVLCNTIWSTWARGFILLSQGAPHTAARCYRKSWQVRWRQQRADRVESAVQVALSSAKGSPLHLGCKLWCFWDFSMSSCSYQLPGMPLFIPPTGAEELQGKHILQLFYSFCPLRICIQTLCNVSHAKLHCSICY